MVSNRTLVLEEILPGNLPLEKGLHSVCTYFMLGLGTKQDGYGWSQDKP